MNETYRVTLRRDEKQVVIVMRGSDYSASLKIDKANTPKMKWGSGKQWTVVGVAVA